MRVLVACEYSGVVRDAFIKKGHDAVSCDLLPTDNSGPHYQGDVLNILHEGWDLMIAHPPCTYLSNSGVCWLYKNKSRDKNLERWELMKKGAKFFKALLDAPIDKICVENPIMHGYAKEIIGSKQSQVVQPYMFGHTEKKATCLWLKGLPLLESTNNVKEKMETLPKREQQRLHFLPPSKDRWKERSKTFPGIAEAMASQWG